MPKVKTNAASKKRKRNLDHTALVDSANIKQVRSLLNMR